MGNTVAGVGAVVWRCERETELSGEDRKGDGKMRWLRHAKREICDELERTEAEVMRFIVGAN